MKRIFMLCPLCYIKEAKKEVLVEKKTEVDEKRAKLQAKFYMFEKHVFDMSFEVASNLHKKLEVFQLCWDSAKPDARDQQFLLGMCLAGQKDVSIPTQSCYFRIVTLIPSMSDITLLCVLLYLQGLSKEKE